MKTIQFRFSHPVNGHARLVPLSCKGVECRNLKVASAENNLLEIPVSDCEKGSWKLVLDWEYEGRNFTHQEEFTITRSPRHPHPDNSPKGR
ncbi:FixH family protein [Mucilaginibacter aquariorum]|uniref:FixH family protein n=1 Tax=Mucilaginibacter aquariorum TaxID=2967225 RepID=A0ABT1T3K0_9SPHI|nr:FixH family protein [Mucilaginibacter aquariorum]MCQ6959192.1 FixH family protein [Mucilaginibacter aquariorum]